MKRSLIIERIKSRMFSSVLEQPALQHNMEKKKAAEIQDWIIAKHHKLPQPGQSQSNPEYYKMAGGALP
jgi:hypothetical protein